MTRRATLVGLLVAVGVSIVAAFTAVLVWQSAVGVRATDRASAMRAMDDLRRALGPVPRFRIIGGRAVPVAAADPSAGRQAIGTIHLLMWSEQRQALLRARTPYWLYRLTRFKAGVTAALGPGALGDTLRIALPPLDQYGPGLLVDHAAESGDRLLMWASR